MNIETHILHESFSRTNLIEYIPYVSLNIILTAFGIIGKENLRNKLIKLIFFNFRKFFNHFSSFS